MESIFVDAVNSTRKQILRRKLRTELEKRGTGPSTIGKASVDSAVVSGTHEDTLLKLIDLGKDKIKLVDFTESDKQHLVDIFVNN